MKEKRLIGSIIFDGGKLGIIINEVRYTIITGEKPVWIITYEIKYSDGTMSLIKKDQMDKLIKMGKITILED